MEWGLQGADVGWMDRRKVKEGGKVEVIVAFCMEVWTYVSCVPMFIFVLHSLRLKVFDYNGANQENIPPPRQRFHVSPIALFTLTFSTAPVPVT
jgi:hypothetical protein